VPELRWHHSFVIPLIEVRHMKSELHVAAGENTLLAHLNQHTEVRVRAQ
jgi:hypothetical protein